MSGVSSHLSAVCCVLVAGSGHLKPELGLIDSLLKAPQPAHVASEFSLCSWAATGSAGEGETGTQGPGRHRFPALTFPVILDSEC